MYPTDERPHIVGACSAGVSGIELSSTVMNYHRVWSVSSLSFCSVGL